MVSRALVEHHSCLENPICNWMQHWTDYWSADFPHPEGHCSTWSTNAVWIIPSQSWSRLSLFKSLLIVPSVGNSVVSLAPQAPSLSKGVHWWGGASARRWRWWERTPVVLRPWWFHLEKQWSLSNCILLVWFGGRISRLPEQPCWLYDCSTPALTTPQKVLSIWRLVELEMLDFSDRSRTGISSLTSASDFLIFW